MSTVTADERRELCLQQRRVAAPNGWAFRLVEASMGRLCEFDLKVCRTYMPLGFHQQKAGARFHYVKGFSEEGSARGEFMDYGKGQHKVYSTI